MLAGCGAASAGPPRRSSLPPAPPIPAVHVAVVVFENRGPAALLRSGWLADQARQGGTATNAHGLVHPSLGNYLALLSGSNQGVHDDDVRHGPYAASSLAGQLNTAGVSWKAYMNAMPAPCYGRASERDTTGRYAKRHNPFEFFDDVVADPASCIAHVVPGSRLPADIAAGTLPTFVWLTPDLCQDMHDCSVATGKRWMASALPPLIHALGPRGVLFVTADEGTDDVGGGGRVPLVALGSGVRSGSVLRGRVDHRNLLATIEDVLGVPRLATTRHLATIRALLRD